MKRTLVSLLSVVYVIFLAWLFGVELGSRGWPLGYTTLCATAVAMWIYFFPGWK